MRFAHPAVLWFLLLLPGLLWLVCHGEKRRLAFLCRFGEPALLRRLPSRAPWAQNAWVVRGLALLPFVCILLALGEPRYPLGPSHIRAGVLDTVMVLDVSKSMAAEDYGTQSRLAQAQDIARHMLEELRGNRVGLVTFVGASFRQADLSDDIDALDFILHRWVRIESVSIAGSNLPQAIETGLGLFETDTARQKLMIILSDGGNETETLSAALAKATQQGVRIVTLGLGQLEPSRLPIYDTKNEFTGYLKVDGQVVTSSLNEANLQRTAKATGGVYVRIQHGQEWQNLVKRPDIAGTWFVHEERKMFQPFLFVGLLAFAAQTLRARL
jgi:Ca-activated chloride channel family protein